MLQLPNHYADLRMRRKLLEIRPSLLQTHSFQSAKLFRPPFRAAGKKDSDKAEK
ncbi:hypothetical protein bcgnr5380_57520 [Bacillus cereus]